jgi:hypothetical protein
MSPAAQQGPALPADPPNVEEIVAVVRQAGERHAVSGMGRRRSPAETAVWPPVVVDGSPVSDDGCALSTESHLPGGWAWTIPWSPIGMAWQPGD